MKIIDELAKLGKTLKTFIEQKAFLLPESFESFFKHLLEQQEVFELYERKYKGDSVQNEEKIIQQIFQRRQNILILCLMMET